MKYIKIVETIKISSEEDLKKYHKQFVSEGYEGTMVRTNDSLKYESNKRSTSLLKYKDFQDTVLPIKNITPNDANPDMGTPWFHINGIDFKAGLSMDFDERRDFLTNKDKYIGVQARLRYFELTEDGVPRFPVFVGFLEH